MRVVRPLPPHYRLGFRTEKIAPLSLKEGVTIRRRLPLDGNEGHAKLEVRANLCLPEPEVRPAESLGLLMYTSLRAHQIGRVTG